MTETNVYELYVDGQLYGKGPIDFVHTLIDDYVVTSGEANFTVKLANCFQLDNVVCIHGYKGADIEVCDECNVSKPEADEDDLRSIVRAFVALFDGGYVQKTKLSAHVDYTMYKAKEALEHGER